MRNEIKPSDWHFVKRRARQFVLFSIIGDVKYRHLSAEAIFAQKKKNIRLYLKKTKVVSISFRLRLLPCNNLKEIDF